MLVSIKFLSYYSHIDVYNIMCGGGIDGGCGRDGIGTLSNFFFLLLFCISFRCV